MLGGIAILLILILAIVGVMYDKLQDVQNEIFHLREELKKKEQWKQ